MPPGQSLDLYNYTLTAQYDRPTSTAANRLASETSAVTYNRDSGNLFVIGDEGTAIVELTRGGVLVGSMAFATPLDDTEGIAWIDDNQFVVSEERTRTIKRLEYTGGTTLAAGAISAVKIGTTIDNIGIEGISYDPLDDGYVMVKEKDPLGLFFTEIDFGAGTASNGSPTTIDSTNLFNPALAGVTDFSDIYALSNVLPPVAQDVEDLLVVGQENGVLLKMDRSGNIRSRLNVGIPAQHEGVAADENGIIYMANELGGGNGMPQLWVYTPTTSPTAVGIGSRLFLSFATNVSAGTGNIALSNGAGDTRSIAIGDTSQITFSGRTVTVDLATDLVPGSTYSVTAPAGLIRATTGGARSSAINTGFATRGDSLAPRLSSSIPADNAAGIVSSRIELQFNESVRAGTGDIVISDGMSDTRTIAVGDATQVTITGASVVIVPTLPLSSLTAYNVQMAAGVVEDLSGNDFVGLTTPTALNFTTANIGGAPPSTLNAGDILFMGINGDAT
ncbi:MAG TPA: SdiA-regulated domain-containing protein, partial [Fontimonas sp.]